MLLLSDRAGTLLSSEVLLHLLYFLHLVQKKWRTLNVFTKQQTGKVSDTVKCERCRADVQLAASYDCTRD